MLTNDDLYRTSDDRKLEAQANRLLAGKKKKKTRRGKKKKPGNELKKVQNKILMKQKKERAQMFRDFERLIADLT